MRIGFDYSAAAISSERTGIGNYASRLMRALLKIDCENQYVLYPVLSNFRLHSIGDFPEARNLEVAFKTALPKLLWFYGGMTRFGEYLLGNVDVVHSTAFWAPRFRSRKKRLVVTIYDLTVFTHPECHTKETLKGATRGINDAIRHADAIIAISNHTKDDLMNHLKAPEGLITVTPLAAGPDYRLIEDGRILAAVMDRYGLPSKYILFVGSLEPRKNVRSLLKAYSNLPERLKKEFFLVIAGARGWLNSDIPLIVSDLKIEDRVRFTGYIAGEDIAAVYSQATVFTYPSLYEGFGLPVLEAMSCGAPVITSNTSSMPEVAGDAARLISPADVDELTWALEYVLENEDARNDMRLKGLRRAAGFSWEKCARETLEVYRKAAG